MSDLNAKFQARSNLPAYLSELEQLMRRAVSADELLSLEETHTIRERAAKFKRTPIWKRELPFSVRETPRFRVLIDQLSTLNSASIYIWTPRAYICGLHRPVPLQEINFHFAFNINREGIFSLLTGNLRNGLLLDFSEEAAGVRTLEIELSGENWGLANY